VASLTAAQIRERGQEFEARWARHRDHVLRYLRGQEPAEYEDVTQEVLADLWRKHDDFRRQSTEKTWVMGFAFIALKRYRKKRQKATDRGFKRTRLGGDDVEHEGPMRGVGDEDDGDEATPFIERVPDVGLGRHGCTAGAAEHPWTAARIATERQEAGVLATMILCGELSIDPRLVEAGRLVVTGEATWATAGPKVGLTARHLRNLRATARHQCRPSDGP
jgi:DNA-directed RNA polymerase specialized sigma24 family protein